jgi:hypothetical protein
VEVAFPEKDRKDAADLLERECGDQVPFSADLKPADMERIRFAVIKLSKGHIREMPQWIKLARTDWRDLFMAADFGYHIDAHRKWFASVVSRNTDPARRATNGHA